MYGDFSPKNSQHRIHVLVILGFQILANLHHIMAHIIFVRRFLGTPLGNLAQLACTSAVGGNLCVLLRNLVLPPGNFNANLFIKNRLIADGDSLDATAHHGTGCDDTLRLGANGKFHFSTSIYSVAMAAYRSLFRVFNMASYGVISIASMTLLKILAEYPENI